MRWEMAFIALPKKKCSANEKAYPNSIGTMNNAFITQSHYCIVHNSKIQPVAIFHIRTLIRLCYTQTQWNTFYQHRMTKQNIFNTKFEWKLVQKFYFFVMTVNMDIANLLRVEATEISTKQIVLIGSGQIWRIGYQKNAQLIEFYEQTICVENDVFSCT